MSHITEARRIGQNLPRDDPTTTNYLRNPQQSGLGASSSLPALLPKQSRQQPAPPLAQMPMRKLPPVEPDALPPPPLPPRQPPPPQPLHFQLNSVLPAKPLPNILNSMNTGGRQAQQKLLSEVITYAETEMRARGVPRKGYSEARLAVWREVYVSLFETLPSYRQVLMRVQHEYDEAIRALSRQLSEADAQTAAAWVDQQELMELRAHSRAQRSEDVPEPAAAKSAKGGAGGRRVSGKGGAAVGDGTSATAEDVLASVAAELHSLSEPQRVQALVRAASSLSPERSTEVLLELLKLQAKDSEPHARALRQLKVATLEGPEPSEAVVNAGAAYEAVRDEAIEARAEVKALKKQVKQLEAGGAPH
eukprot:jgi/Chrpa1/11865/Chrysochromulina_OHIO_Genome00021145-RA